MRGMREVTEKLTGLVRMYEEVNKGGGGERGDRSEEVPESEKSEEVEQRRR